VNYNLFEVIYRISYRTTTCGKFVAIGLLEFFGIAKYVGTKGFVLKNKENINQQLVHYN
jgi:hypothetical protein